jgi:hypothetical protein
MRTGTGIEGLQGIRTIAGLHGALRGLLDPGLDIGDPIPDAEIVARPADGDARALAAAALMGGSRRPVVLAARAALEEASAASGTLTGRTDADGRFTLAGRLVAASWRVYACFDCIRPVRGAPAPLGRRVCFDLGVYAAGTRIEAVIPQKLYRALMGMADRWTVFGTLTGCASGAPIAGAIVTAHDTDWVQHDALGSATTGPTGLFRVDFPGSAFRRGTVADIELLRGPDVFFRVTDAAGCVLIDEPPAAGRAPGRADRGLCARVDLRAP